ncbi:hypothetical protein ABF86_11065 [Nitrosomonas sp. GH22]|uniref:hypothetical protein n=1 Tax=Nitrosomonas sp. GH22 TaxID=153947 RepID=UPI00136D6A3C|nr:hypothetical protein [Nitrosomonas sp. GH22]MXS81236.1 hypothetical protein [Nitrosomonas sp. GH22]
MGAVLHGERFSPNKANHRQAKASRLLLSQNPRHFCLPVICGVMRQSIAQLQNSRQTREKTWLIQTVIIAREPDNSSAIDAQGANRLPAISVMAEAEIQIPVELPVRAA